MKKLLSVSLTLIFLIAIFFIISSQGKIDVLKHIRLQDIILIICLFLVSSTFTSFSYFLSFKERNCILTKEDIFFFPLMQSFFSLIFPFQGSAVFTIGYLKIKYNLKVVESIPVIIFLYLINFLFAGMAGIIYYFSVKNTKFIFLFFSFMLLLMPLWLWLTYKVLEKFPNIPLIPQKIRNMILNFFQNLNDLFCGRHLLYKLLLFQCCRHLTLGSALYILAKACGINATWLWGYILIISQELALIIKITPGGIGTIELITGLVCNLSGITVSDGITIAFLQRVIFDLVTIVLGSVGFILCFRKLNFSYRSFLQKIKESK